MARPVFATPPDAAYTPAIERLLPSDPASADSVFNPLLQRVITNVHAAYLQGLHNSDEIGRVRDGIGGGLYKAVRMTGNPVRAVSGAYPLQSLCLLGPLPAGTHTVHVCGNNYFDIDAPHGHNASSATVTVTSNAITAVTKASEAAYRAVTYPEPIQLKPSTQYTITATIGVANNKDNSSRGFLRVGDGKDILIGSISGALADGVERRTYTFTAPADGKVRLSFRYHNTDTIPLSGGITVSWSDIMLNEGTPALPYEPYQGTAYTVTAAADIPEGGSLPVPGVVGVNGDNVVVNSADAQMEAAFAPPVPTLLDAVADCADAISSMVTTIQLTTLNGWTSIVRPPILTVIAGKIGIVTGHVQSPDNGQSLEAVPTGAPLAVLPSEYKPSAITYAMGVRDNGIYATGDAMVNTSMIAGGLNLYAYGTAANPLPPKTSVSIQLIYLI